MDVDEVASLVTDRTRLIVINRPHNPTGGDPDRAPTCGGSPRSRSSTTWSSSPTRSTARILYEGEHAQHRDPARHGGAHDHARRLLEDLRHDRLAARLRDRAGLAAPAVQRLIINSVSCTHAFAQVGAVEALTGPQDDGRALWSRSSAPAATLIVDGLNAIPGVTLRDAARRVLRVPEHHRHRHAARRGRRSPARRRRRVPAWPAPRSASTARATCASATRTRARTCPSPSSGWRARSRSSSAPASSSRRAHDRSPAGVRRAASSRTRASIRSGEPSTSTSGRTCRRRATSSCAGWPASTGCSPSSPIASTTSSSTPPGRG